MHDGRESPHTGSDDDDDRSQAESRVGKARPEDHHALAELVRQDQQDQERGYGEESRQATLAKVELAQTGPQEGEQRGQRRRSSAIARGWRVLIQDHRLHSWGGPSVTSPSAAP